VICTPHQILFEDQIIKMSWAGSVNVWRRGEVRAVLVGKPEGRSQLGRPRRRWKEHIKMDLREVELEHGLDRFGSV
jgi:hypothetical protein